MHESKPVADGMVAIRVAAVERPCRSVRMTNWLAARIQRLTTFGTRAVGAVGDSEDVIACKMPIAIYLMGCLLMVADRR